MRIGYGYNRIEKEFAHANCDRIWIDGKHTERSERSAMLSFGLRSGDTLVLLARGDLGHGGELTIIHRALADRGITMEVCPKDKPEKRPRGRPATFNPTPEQDKMIAALWSDPVENTRSRTIRLASEIMGHPVTRNQLYHRYGKRE